jgi:hypothetical protein
MRAGGLNGIARDPRMKVLKVNHGPGLRESQGVGARMSFKATRVETHLNAPPTTTKLGKLRKMLLENAINLLAQRFYVSCEKRRCLFGLVF